MLRKGGSTTSSCENKGRSVRLSETEGGWKRRHPLKGPILTLIFSKALTLGSGGETEAQRVLGIFREKFCCVALG